MAREIRIIDYHASSLKDVAFYAGQILGHEIKIDFIDDQIKVTKYRVDPECGHRSIYKYGKHWLPHDARAKTLASNKSVIEQLGAAVGLDKCGIVPDLSIQDGIQAVRMMLPRCWFDRRVDDGVQAIKQYQREYDEDKKCFREKPRHDWCSHPSDAMRMLAISCRDVLSTAQAETAIRGITVFNNTATLDEMWMENKIQKRTRI